MSLGSVSDKVLFVCICLQHRFPTLVYLAYTVFGDFSAPSMADSTKELLDSTLWIVREEKTLKVCVCVGGGCSPGTGVRTCAVVKKVEEGKKKKSLRSVK